MGQDPSYGIASEDSGQATLVGFLVLAESKS
jgi:hypothetical protein